MVLERVSENRFNSVKLNNLFFGVPFLEGRSYYREGKTQKKVGNRALQKKLA